MLAKALMNTLRNIHEVAWSCLVNEQLTENTCERKKMTVQMKGMQKKPCTFPAEHGTLIQSNQMCVEVAEVIYHSKLNTCCHDFYITSIVYHYIKVKTWDLHIIHICWQMNDVHAFCNSKNLWKILMKNSKYIYIWMQLSQQSYTRLSYPKAKSLHSLGKRGDFVATSCSSFTFLFI